MANNLTSNVTNKIARVFLPEFEKMRVVSKTVDTGTLMPDFTPQFGETIKVKRPHQYKAVETTDGNLNNFTQDNQIISGSAPAKVQSYITVKMDWTNREEALELDQLREIIQPAAEECVTRLETKFQEFLIQNSGLSYGSVGNPLTKWGDIANFYALMCSIGVPQAGDHYAVMNPFMTRNLADTQSGLASGSNNLVDTAWNNAQISRNFGGMKALMSNSMSSFKTGSMADRVGSIKTTPDQTYLTAKDTMTQTVVLTDLTNGQEIVAGDVIEVTGRNRTNIKTRQVAFDETGSPIPWRWTVVTGGQVASNDVTITVTNAAIFEFDSMTATTEVTGQYDNIDSKIVATDIVTILGATDTTYAPSLFYHKTAAGIRTVRLPKLHTWDTVAETSDGLSVRVTKFSDGTKNTQQIRFDLLPAFAMFNPLFCGTGWGE